MQQKIITVNGEKCTELKRHLMRLFNALLAWTTLIEENFVTFFFMEKDPKLC